MKTFVINLDNAKARLRETTQELARIGLSFERVPGVDGNALPARVLRHEVCRWRFLLSNARRIQRPEVGCALAHRAVWNRVAESEEPFTLVLEDDVEAEDAAQCLAAIHAIEAHGDPAKPCVWLLQECPAANGLNPQEGGVYPASDGASCAAAYILTRPAAKRLAAANTPIVALCDAWGRWQACGVAVFWVVPFPFRARRGTSQIAWEAPRRARWAWYQRLWRIRHALGKGIDRWLLRHFPPEMP